MNEKADPLDAELSVAGAGAPLGAELAEALINEKAPLGAELSATGVGAALGAELAEAVMNEKADPLDGAPMSATG